MRASEETVAFVVSAALLYASAPAPVVAGAGFTLLMAATAALFGAGRRPPGEK